MYFLINSFCIEKNADYDEKLIDNSIQFYILEFFVQNLPNVEHQFIEFSLEKCLKT